MTESYCKSIFPALVISSFFFASQSNLRDRNMDDENLNEPLEEHLEKIIRKKTDENFALQNLLNKLEEKQDDETNKKKKNKR